MWKVERETKINVSIWPLSSISTLIKKNMHLSYENFILSVIIGFILCFS